MGTFRGILRAVSVSSLLLLVACTGEEQGPSFANNPVATREPTVVPVAATPALLPLATPPPIATPSSIADLLNSRGAVSHVFMASDSVVWAIDSTGDADLIFEAPRGSVVRAVDSSPGAQMVAILLQTDGAASGKHELVVVDLQGAVDHRWAGFERGGATPVPEGPVIADLVNWSPQGNQILVGLRGGALYSAELENDELRRLSLDADGGQVISAGWSPTGETIAFIAAGKDGKRTLRVFQTRDDRTSVAATLGAGMSVVEFSWMPDGVSLLFTAGGGPGAAVTGVDLWRIDTDGEGRSLLASAGSVAPVAQIGTIRPSPDGRSVAYAVLIPGDPAPRVDSIWIRDIATRVGYRVALPTISTVENIWWTDKGLVVAVTTPGTDIGRRPMLALLRLNPTGAMDAIWVAPLGAATPAAATPVVVATPTAA